VTGHGILHAMRGDPPAVSEPVRPLRRSDYEQLVDAGVFEDERIELLDGAIYEMTPIGAAHLRVTAWIAKRLTLALGDDFDVICQSSFAATHWSMPEPDIVVTTVELSRPRRAALVIEVSETSLSRDRYKERIYATARVPEYWLFDLPHRSVEVYTQPRGGHYTKIRLETVGAVLCPVALPSIALTLDDQLLPMRVAQTRPSPPPRRRRRKRQHTKRRS
jgi:Uma2 family endonuclease